MSALSDSQKKFLELSTSAYVRQLGAISPGSDPNGVIDYFRSHAVTFEQARQYRIGYVSEPVRGDERFTGRIAIPYLTNAGVVGINYRGLGDTTPKYLRPHGQRSRPFNTHAYFAATDTLGVAEGEIDAIVATEHLGIPTLGVPGATNFDDLWLPLFKDFQRVLIWQDGDDAGKSFAETLAEKIGWRARIVRCHDGEDVSSMVAKGNASALIQLATGDES